jgi:hypothetical protein
VLRRTLAVALLATLAAAPAVATPDGVVIPVPSTPTLAPTYVGSPATAQPIGGVPRVPRNHFMAANGDSSIHDDGWQSDTYRRPGPLGVSPQTLSSSIGGVCASIAFDRRGRIVTTCVGVTRAVYLVDPRTLDVIDQLALPGLITDSLGSGSNPFQGFSGGAYFYLDHHDRAVIGTADGRFLVVKVRRDGLVLRKQFDLAGLLGQGEVLNSGLPGSDGLVWFVTKKNGGVGTLSLRTGRTRLIRLGNGTDGEIENSIAVGSHGEAYVATNRRLYRFSHSRAGQPVVDWSVAYPSGGSVKPGQVDDGTGTTPTVLPGGYVAITDNADPMNVVVYRTAIHRNRSRQVCSVPVFGHGAGSTENSLIGAGRSLIVENNYGYTGPASVLLGQSTVPGFARVDIRRHGRGCRLVWTNSSVSAPTVVPKLSLATGLIYAYTKPAGDLTDPWYWTAIDYRTGAVVWKVLAGAGPAYNNNYAGLALGPDGTAYLGVIPGMIALRDG